MKRAAALVIAGLVLQPGRAALAELRTWIDKDGVYHVEGVDPHKPRKRAPAAPPAEGPPAARSEQPSWQKPNLPPRKPGSSKSSAAGKKKPGSKWWMRRSDAPPDEIDHAAEVYKIPAELIRAVISVESAGDAGAISHKGAIGLMQLMPKTAGEMYVQDAVDPAQNVLGGTRYLRHLANQFGGDMLLVLAAYNAGPEAVRKYGGVPPFPETREYVRRVMANYYELKKSGGRRIADSGARAGAEGGRP